LNGVIRGWSEGVQLMPVGSKYMMWIPSDLAYGAQPPSQLIKPNSTLEFEVELLEVMKAK
jgi:FKBP-type peptidyl-prolyl cis-trans isomerase